MSLELPAHPNLEHLRKQAKTLLTELQQRDPSVQLADAQYQLARNYGFASWPKLKVHVESLINAADARPHPLAGRWQANIEQSEQHPDNPVRSANLDITVAGELVTISQVVVDLAGRDQSGVISIRADGEDHASENGHGYSLRAAWTEDRVLETTAIKDGARVGWGRYEVSPDGSSLVVTANRMRVLFERVASNRES